MGKNGLKSQFLTLIICQKTYQITNYVHLEVIGNLFWEALKTKKIEKVFCFKNSKIPTPHIRHNHHNRWLCKSFESSVKFSTGYMKESALSVIFLQSVQSYTGCSISPTLAILHNV